jgi:hypothetical protein
MSCGWFVGGHSVKKWQSGLLTSQLDRKFDSVQPFGLGKQYWVKNGHGLCFQFTKY